MVIVTSRKTDSAGPIFISSFVIAIRLVYWSFISLFVPLPFRPSIFVLEIPRSLVSLRASTRVPPSRWETINLEYPVCWKRTEWKIFPFTVMFRELFSGSEDASQDASWNIRWAISLRVFRPPFAGVPGVSKSLLLVLLKFKNVAHNFATSLSSI